MHSGLTPYCDRLAFKGLCSGGGGSDNVQFVNSRLRSRQKMPLLQRSKAILLSVNKILVFRLSNVSIPLSICGFSGMFFCGALANFL